MQPLCCASFGWGTRRTPHSVAVAQHRTLAHLLYVDAGSSSSLRVQLMHSRRPVRFPGMVIIAFAATMCARESSAQAPPRAAQATQAGRDGNRAPDYPVRPPAPPEQVSHGQQVFQSNCSFCHGSDARGGEAGPNLVRDEVVLRDQNGELITPIV